MIRLHGKLKKLTPKDIEKFFSVTRVLVAILISLLFAFMVIALVSNDPVAAIRNFIVVPLTSKRLIGDMFSKFIPLLFTGASVCFIFSAGQTNMAVEGGFLLGALGATIIATMVELPPVLHITVCCFVGGAFGALACLVPAVMYVKLGAKPIISSMMMNFICLYIATGLINNVMKDPSAGFNASHKFASSATLPKLVSGTSVHIGLIIGLVVVIFSYLYIYKSKRGYEIRIIGKSMDFAGYSGIPISKVLLSSQIIGGFIAGLGGAVEVLGMYNRFQYTGQTGLGFDGIMVGVMAAYNPKLIPLAALFLAYVREGADILMLKSDIPMELVNIIQTIIIMLVAAERFLYKSKHKLIVKVADTEKKRIEVK